MNVIARRACVKTTHWRSHPPVLLFLSEQDFLFLGATDGCGAVFAPHPSFPFVIPSGIPKSIPVGDSTKRGIPRVISSTCTSFCKPSFLSTSQTYNSDNTDNNVNGDNILMQQRLTVFSLTSEPLAELDAAVHATWLQGELGALQFTLAAGDAKCTERSLRFGNFVLFESDQLPAWGGVIWPPRQWGSGMVTVHAHAAEFQFKRRLLESAGLLMTGNAASLFAQLVELGNARGDLRIELGNLATASEALVLEARRQTIWDAIKEIEASSGEEWWLQPETGADHRLVFKANWAPQRGAENPLALVEGRNFALDGTAAEVSDLVNHITVIGEGLAAPPTSLAADERSQALYGATYAAEFVASSSPAALQARALQLIRERAQPRLLVPGRMLSEAAFGQLRLGDRYPLALNAAGFSSRRSRLVARLQALEFDSEENSLGVLLEQIPEVA